MTGFFVGSDMPEETSNYIHIPIRDKDDFVKESFRTITISERQGILAVIGKLKSDPNGSTHVQKYLFDKEKGWTLERARRWVEEHRHSLLEEIMEEYKMEGYKPTKEELAIINERFAKEAYKSIDDLHVFWLMAIDNQLTLYGTKAHPDTLNKWAKDLENGVSFLVGHQNNSLPFARSFKGLVREHEGLVELYGKFFMQKGLKIGEIETDDFMKAYLGGTLQDVSVGFKAGWYECSICGLDIRDPDCPHLPLQKYEIDGKEVLCFAWIMHSSEKPSELFEVSCVYKGAVPKAKLKGKKEVPANFVGSLDELKKSDLDKELVLKFSIPVKEIDSSLLDPPQDAGGQGAKGGENNMDIDQVLSQEVSEEEALILKERFSNEELEKLLVEFPAYELLDNKEDYERWTRAFINDLPNSSFAVIEPAYTKGETDNKNARHLPHHGKGGGGTRNENLDLPHLRNALARANQIRPITNSISTEELRQKASTHLEHHRSALTSERKEEDFIKLESELKTAQTNNKVLLEQNETLKKDLTNSTKQIEELKSTNVELQAKIKELEPKAKDGQTYRDDLINEALELGVKLQGNSFDKETYEKMLREPQRSIDEIKNIRDQFLNTLMEKFPIGKQTKEQETNLPDAGEQSIVPDEAYKV